MGVALFQGAEEEMCRATDQGCKWVGGGSSGCALIFCKALRTHPVLCSVEAVLSACLTDASLCPAGLLRALHLQRPKHQRAERVS